MDALHRILTDNPPGLVNRKVIASDEHTVTLKETWDLRAPGCPMVAVKFYPRFEMDTAAISGTRIYTIPKY